METKRIGKDTGCLFVLIVLYLVSRLPVILSSSATTDRSLLQGVVAKEFLEGFTLPWWNYLIEAYALAPLFNGLLTAPFFLLFGETMFSLKLVPFFWHLISLIVWYYVWRPCFTLKQTFFVMLLFIFTTPWIIQFSTFNDGKHCDMILWTGISLLILRRVVTGGMSAGLGGFLLGVLGGFASGLILTYLGTAVIIWIYLILSRQKKRVFLMYLIGFLVGFSPMLYHNAFHVSWLGLGKIEELYGWLGGEIEWIYLWRLFIPLLLSDLRNGVGGLFGFWDLGSPWNLVLGYFYLYLYLFSLAILIYRKWGFWKGLSRRFDAESFGLMYQLFHLFLMMMAIFSWGLQYAMPMVPFIGMTIVSSASVFGLWWRRGIGAFCLLAGIIGVALSMDWKQMGQTRHLQGFSYREMGWSLNYQLNRQSGVGFDLFWKLSDQFLKGRKPEIIKAFYQGVDGDEYFFHAKEEIPKRLNFIRHLPESLHPLYYRKFGKRLTPLLASDLERFESILQEYEISKNFYPDIYYGFVMGLIHSDIGEGLYTEGLQICSDAPEFTKSACYEGVGAVADEDYPISKSKFLNHLKYIAEIPDKYRPPYFLGIGRCFFPLWIKDSKEVKGFIDSLTEEELRWFYKGILSEIELVEDPWRQKELEKRLAASLH